MILIAPSFQHQVVLARATETYHGAYTYLIKLNVDPSNRTAVYAKMSEPFYQHAAKKVEEYILNKTDRGLPLHML